MAMTRELSVQDAAVQAPPSLMNGEDAIACDQLAARITTAPDAAARGEPA